MLVDAFCLLLMTDELFNKLHINRSVEAVGREDCSVFSMKVLRAERNNNNKTKDSVLEYMYCIQFL